jgi:phage portal protein BeeE
MRSFRPLFLGRKIDIKELQGNMEQLQMVPLRKHEREAIIQVFGLPPEKLGLLQNSNRATIVAADHHWTADVLRPRLERLRRVMQRELVPLFDDRIIIDFDTPVARDEEMQLATMKAASHAFTVNDWRKRAGMESAADGDVYVVPLNSEIVAQGSLKLHR